MVFANVTADGLHIAVQTEYRDKELIKIVPGATWKSTEKMWYTPLSWASCIVLRGVFGDQLQIGETLNNWAYTERSTRVDPALFLRDAVDTVHHDETPYAGLFTFQKAGVDFLTTAGDALLGDEMGTGKTVQAVVALRNIGDEDALPALVICPNSVKRPWAREITKWHATAKPYIVTGSVAAKRRTMIEASNDPNAIVIINIESVRQFSRLAPYGSIHLKKCHLCDTLQGDEDLTPAKCEVHVKELNRLPFKTVILDEAHRIKDPKSKQTRATWSVMHGKTVKRRWALTGTPIATHPGDLWSVMHGVCRAEYPAKSKFVDRYCLQAWNHFGGMDIIGIEPRTKDEFFRILDPRFRRMPKALVLKDLPPKIRTQRYVTMTPKQAKAYKEMENGLISRLEDGSLLIAPNNLVAHARLLQLSSSYAEIIKVDPLDATTWTVRLKDPSPKIDELLVLLDELDVSRQVAVAAQSRQLIELTAARLDKENIPFSIITGAVTEAERDYQLAEFQAGRRRVMLFTVQAGGTGLTMTAADTIIFMQRSWSMIDNKQAEDRVHRIGSEIHEHIHVIDIVTDDTVESTHQMPRLLDKFARLEEITRDRELLRRMGHDLTELDTEETKIMNQFVG